MPTGERKGYKEGIGIFSNNFINNEENYYVER